MVNDSVPARTAHVTICNESRLNNQLRLALSCLENFKHGEPSYNVLVDYESISEVANIILRFCGKPGAVILDANSQPSAFLFEMPDVDLFIHVQDVNKASWVTVVRGDALADHLFAAAYTHAGVSLRQAFTTQRRAVETPELVEAIAEVERMLEVRH